MADVENSYRFLVVKADGVQETQPSSVNQENILTIITNPSAQVGYDQRPIFSGV